MGGEPASWACLGVAHAGVLLLNFAHKGDFYSATPLSAQMLPTRRTSRDHVGQVQAMTLVGRPTGPACGR
jgi:hypothetical protein